MRTRRPSLLAVGFGLGLIVACGGDADGPASGWQFTTEVLPNGAVHAVNTPPPGGGEPTVRLVPDLRIGSLDEEGPTSFGEIKGIAVTPDGRIGVLDSQAQELRIFGPDGTHLVTYGGRGGGPGEMEDANGLMVGPAGRFWVPDARSARMSVFDPDDGFIDSYPVRFLRFGYIWQGSMGADGLIRKPSLTLEPRRDLLRVYDRRMTLVDSLFMPPGPDVDEEDPPSAFVFRGETGGGSMAVPFFPSGAMQIGPDGAIWSTAYGDPSYRIMKWIPEGDTTLVIETLRDPVPVTAAERESGIAAVRSFFDRFGIDEEQDWSKIPEVKPAVSGLFVADDGHLWVRRPVPEGAAWDVYDPDGRRVVSVETELTLTTYLDPVVRDGRFYGVARDELDVSYVIRAALPPAEATESAS